MSVTAMMTGCLRPTKVCHIYSIRQKVVLVEYEKYETLSMIYVHKRFGNKLLFPPSLPEGSFKLHLK